MDSPEQEKDNEEQEKASEDTASTPNMKIPMPVWIAYGVLTIVFLIMYHELFLTGKYFPSVLLLMLLSGEAKEYPLFVIWIGATGVLIMIKSQSLIRNKENGGKAFAGYVFWIIGLVLVLAACLMVFASLLGGYDVQNLSIACFSNTCYTPRHRLI